MIAVSVSTLVSLVVANTVLRTSSVDSDDRYIYPKKSKKKSRKEIRKQILEGIK